MRADLLGCSVDVLTMAETVERARVAMRDQGRLQHVALNVAKFVNMRSDRILRSDVMGSAVYHGRRWVARCDRRLRAASPPNHAVEGARMVISSLPGAASHVVAICQDKYPFRRNTDSRHFRSI